MTGSGEMADRIRAFAWAGTPLGPLESWSPALRTTTSILLANALPMLLWWGPDFISLYNDAYRPILGVKHPWALGQPVRICWSEIWTVLRPLIEAPFRGAPATWMEDICLEINRHGFAEETHFTIAYSPVPDETAPEGIGGVLATVHEISDQVVNQRRVAVLRDLGSSKVSAKTPAEACSIAAASLAAHTREVPFALIYLMDADRTHARLAASAGIDRSVSGCPDTIDFAEDTGPFAAICREAVETGEDRRLAPLRIALQTVPAGPWSDPPDAAVVVPIRSNLAEPPVAIFVGGVSARLRFDEAYRSFFNLVASHLAAAVANARAYDEERKRAEALAELDRTKTEFFSNVSHEFRTPLSLIVGPLDHLLSMNAEALPAPVQTELDVARRNCRRLTKLVNMLLDFSRIEAGRTDAHFEPTDLGTRTGELASLFRSALEAAGLQYAVDCPPLPEPVYVDPDMWEKIVINLLSNALKFTLRGTIAVKLAAVDDRVQLTVSDTGVGIPKGEIPRLFERFHRARGAPGRSHEGTGIGLASVRELARLHGGTVEVASEEGRGSAFTVTLPLGHAHLPADRIRPVATPGPFGSNVSLFIEEVERWRPAAGGAWSGSAPRCETQPDRRRFQVLVVDDNADMREYVRRVLEPYYRVELASDGELALAAIRRSPPDLVLSDVMMPCLDGFDLLERLRAKEGTRAIPLILLSARAGEEARVSGLNSGADDYLVKPFGARELVARVRSQLDLAQLRRESAEHIARILEGITDAFIVLDSAGRFAQFNAAARTMFAGQGLDVGNLIERRLFDVLPDARNTPAGQALRRTQVERVVTTTESFYPAWRRWFFVRHYPMDDGGIAIFLQDVTDRKRAEAALRESEERYRQIAARLEQAGIDSSTAPLASRAVCRDGSAVQGA